MAYPIPSPSSFYNLVIEDGAVVPIVAVVLRVEANNRGVWQARAHYKDGVDLEPIGQIGNCADIQAVANVERRVGTVSRQVIGIQPRHAGKGSSLNWLIFEV